MRASLIDLIALVASPLMVFAAPSSQTGSLAERDLAPRSEGLPESMDSLTPKQIIEFIQTASDYDATEFVKKLSDDQATKLFMILPEKERMEVYKKTGFNGKFSRIARMLGLKK